MDDKNEEVEALADWLTTHHGVKDPQMAWELACDLFPLLDRLAAAYRNVVLR